MSKETVSHILGGKHAARYRKETRERVTAIAQELRYRPHRGAQMMKSGRSNLIAIVHFGGGLEAADHANRKLSRKVSEAGFDYLAIDMNWYGGSVHRILEELNSARVEGVVISHIQEVFKKEHIDELIQSGIPIVAVNGEQRPNVPLVCDDVIRAFYGLTRHLIDNGHRTILHLTEPVMNDAESIGRSISHRNEGFRQAVEENGHWQEMGDDKFLAAWPTFPVPQGERVKGITVDQDGLLYRELGRPVYTFCQRLFKEERLPDAIICRNDFYVMEAIAAALEHGVSIPGDLALAGYDNDRIGSFPAFGITTAEQDLDGICAKAVEVLLHQIKGGTVEGSPFLFRSKIITRTSSKPQAARTQLAV